MTWHIRAITDECTTCELCGRVELKRTVLLETEDGEQLWAGTSCAAKKVGTTAAKMRGAANTFLNRKAAYESWFPDWYRTQFKMSIREAIEKYGPAAEKGIELTRRQYMKKNGFYEA